MRGKQYDIFISYRRSDGTHTARLFKSEFERRGYRTFLDFDDLTDGKFDKRIENAILDAPVFVMILTNDYFARCNEEDDWVRKEIYCAIENERVIIPVNYDGNLNGIPDYLEQKLKREIGLHQFSTVYADAAFQVTFDKMIKDRVEKVIKIMSDNDPQPQPQPRPKPKPVQTDFNTEYNRCMTTEQYPEAFAACLNEAVLRQNVSSIKSKADNAIANLKGRILIPDCVAHVSYNWLIDRLSAKGYSPIKTHEDSISHKKIRFRISKTSSNRSEITIQSVMHPFFQFFFWIIFIGVLGFGLFGAILFACEAYWEKYHWDRDYTVELTGSIFFGVTTILLLLFGIPGIVRFFKRKKKAIQDVAKICLEECER
ncbi:MAG: toll/interleukin-1 receptor domain-containing protein [Bacteroidales bacterium]|nr:toll/interleukin-1 receptor domain-containing protein [Bacteroidales bacterium]